MSNVPDIDLSFIVSFAIITVLYGSIISPQLTKLASLRDKISLIRFPKKDIWNSGSNQNFDSESKAAGEALEREAYTYELKYGFTKRFLKYFWISIFISILYEAGRFLFNTISQHDTGIANYTFLVVILLVLLLLARSLYKYLIDDDILRSLDWLTNSAGLNPFSILTAFKGSLYLSNNKPFGEAHSVEDDIYFNFASDVHITGLRYYIQVTENHHEDSVYYIGYGPIGLKTFTGRAMHYEGAYHYETRLGSMPMNLIYGKKLKIELFIFAAPHTNDWHNPYIITEFFETPKNKNSSFSLGRSGESFRLERGDGAVAFKGIGYKLGEFAFKDNARLNETLFRKYEKDFKKTKNPVQHIDLQGSLLTAPQFSRWKKFIGWLDRNLEPPTNQS